MALRIYAYDYINRAMPFDEPQSLTPSQVYVVTAYTLRLNDIVGDDAVLDQSNLPGIKLKLVNFYANSDIAFLKTTKGLYSHSVAAWAANTYPALLRGYFFDRNAKA